MGVRILRIKPGEYKIFGNGENSFRQPKKKQLYFGNAGSLGILLGFLATSSNINVRIFGDKSLNSRNMQKFIIPLSKVGATFSPLGKKKFPLVLGGEHSLTSGAIRPFVKKFGKICLLHFDAHADLRNSYNGN